MAAILNTIIPKSGFEVCRDAIGAIILIELTNQKKLQGNAFPEIICNQVLLNSLIPTDSANNVTINVVSANATYSQNTQSESQGLNHFVVDIHTSGTSSAESAYRRDRFVGMIAYIFRSAQYRQLGLKLPQGLIGGVYVEGFEIEDPHQKEDTDYTSFGRVYINVRIQEIASAWAGVPLEINNTGVSLEMSNKGFIFVFEN